MTSAASNFLTAVEVETTRRALELFSAIKLVNFFFLPFLSWIGLDNLLSSFEARKKCSPGTGWANGIGIAVGR